MAITPIDVTISDTTAQKLSGPGRGFSLKPLTNAITGNPIPFSARVRLNADTNNVHVVEDDRALYFDGGFSQLELLGGTAGDRWHLNLMEYAGDSISGGVTAMRSASPIIAQKSTWSAAELARNTVWYLPSVTGTVVKVSNTRPEPFDVSGYTHLVLFVTNDIAPDDATPGSSPVLEVLIEVAGAPNASTEAPYGSFLHQVALGEQRMVFVGAGMAVNLENEVPQSVILQRYPWVRLGYRVTDGVNSTLTSAGVSEVRLVGLR
ncbi:hypothetical protein JRI60_26880 [Archangium violaceum]|uniref:hypothetical protein n=1 Tax=Archangium violaceum TaxID=83451 RepID=UPI0019520801|nr:hypothetical protein [Archangium violaceum]QRN92837.1 hypothetical protein JRI60_26880 [Archangium violaceum]